MKKNIINSTTIIGIRKENPTPENGHEIKALSQRTLERQCISRCGKRSNCVLYRSSLKHYGLEETNNQLVPTTSNDI